MKKMMFLAMMMVMTVSAKAMSYKDAKSEALFLSDKMAYELNLSSAQYDDVYEINLDYLMSVNGRGDAYGTWWNRRNKDLKYVLTGYQYEKYTRQSYFYRPLTWEKNGWSLNVYGSYKGGNNKKSDRFYANSGRSSGNTNTLAHNGNANRSHGAGHSGFGR